MEDIRPWFPMVSAEMWEQLEAAEMAWKDWNQKVNVVSRKDVDLLHLHHIAHSLSILHYTSFARGVRVMDLGTGGGFPGIPLAIASPEASFTLVDSIGKKIQVVREVAAAARVPNVQAIQGRAESLKGPFDLVVTRAVAPAAELVLWTRKLLSPIRGAGRPGGIIALKGGDLKEELRQIPRPARVIAMEPLVKWIPHPFFDQKFLVHISLNG